MSRNIDRSVARRHYERFSRDWRREKRMAGAWGKPGKKPVFSEWYHMHQRDSGMMSKSTPADVQEHLGLDPWVEPSRPEREALRVIQKALGELEGERGVVTIPIIGENE